MRGWVTSRAWAVVAVLIAMTDVLVAEERVWTDATGKFHVTAELIRVEGGVAVLQSDKGRQVRVPVVRLSRKDQAFIREASSDEEAGEGERESPPKADGKLSAAAETGVRDVAVNFFEGLRDADRGPALEALTETARKVNQTPDSPLAQLPAPDQGRRSVLTGRATLDDKMAEIPVRVRAGGIQHLTRLHLRRQQDQWKIFAISATYPDGEKSINFEAEPRAPGESPLESLVGSPMPLAGFTLSGYPLNMSQFAGKVVLVDFWATWCGPCRKEVPNILDSYQQYHDDGFEVVAFSLDEDLDAVRKFATEKALPWTVVADKDPRTTSGMAARYGIRSLPTMILIGRDGKVASVNARGPRLEKEIKSLLAAPQ